MKTARDVLLDHYRNATPDLDRIRRSVVAGLSARPAPRAAWSPLTWAAVLWEQLVLPSRYAWAGIAAVWIILLTANTLITDRSAAAAERQTAALPALLETARAQRELQAELLGCCITARPAPPPAPADQSRTLRRRKASAQGAWDELNKTVLA